MVGIHGISFGIERGVRLRLGSEGGRGHPNPTFKTIEKYCTYVGEQVRVTVVGSNQGLNGGNKVRRNQRLEEVL